MDQKHDVNGQAAGIGFRVLKAPDERAYVVLDIKDGKGLPNEHLALYLAVRPGLGDGEVVALTRALTLACDGILIAASTEHPFYDLLEARRPYQLRCADCYTRFECPGRVTRS